MENDFILIISPEWIEIPNATNFISNIGESQMSEMIVAGEWTGISQFLEDAEIINPNEVILNARMINNGQREDNIRMWIIRDANV